MLDLVEAGARTVADEGAGTEPACRGPAYGMSRVVEPADYVTDVLEALEVEGVPVEQVHPEYAPARWRCPSAPPTPSGR